MDWNIVINYFWDLLLIITKDCYWLLQKIIINYY